MKYPSVTRIMRWAALLIAGLCASSITGCKQLLIGNNLTNAQVAELSAETAVQLDSQYAPADPATPGLSEFMRAAAIVSGNAPGLPVYAHLLFKPIESDEQLSISLPDGHVYVSSGLLTLIAQDPAEIDCLIAHEAGHVALGHDLTNLTAALGQSNLDDMIAQGRYQDVVNTEIELGQLSYTRQQEFAADDYAVNLARKVGFDPRGMLRLLLSVNNQSHTDDEVTWDLSHPIGHQRIARLEREHLGSR